MFTDVCFTHSAPLSAGSPRIAFFQKNAAATTPGSPVFHVIRECGHGWSHRVRIPWDLQFRLVKASGSTTTARPLKTTYGSENKKFLLAKDGTITVQQSYGNGKQLIDFEQIKGNGYASVQLYRGDFLLAEEAFTDRRACFQIDTTIHVLESYDRQESGTVPESHYRFALDLDFTGLRTVQLSLTGSLQTGNKLVVDTIEKW